MQTVSLIQSVYYAVAMIYFIFMIDGSIHIEKLLYETQHSHRQNGGTNSTSTVFQIHKIINIPLPHNTTNQQCTEKKSHKA